MYIKLNIYINVSVCVCLLVAQLASDSFRPPWTIVCQTILSMEFSRQEYWSELPFPSPGDLPDPGTELADSLPSEHQGRPYGYIWVYIYKYKYIYKLNHFAAHRKQTQHCKSTIVQLKKDLWDFPRGLVVKMPQSQCREH